MVLPSIFLFNIDITNMNSKTLTKSDDGIDFCRVRNLFLPLPSWLLIECLTFT